MAMWYVGSIFLMQDFLLTSLQADLEISVLQRVQKLVERNYVDGRPRHHLPAARDTNYTPDPLFFSLSTLWIL